MNLKEIRTKFVDLNGRTDLVVDTTDYADSGANFFIQAGQRMLESLVPTRKSLGKYVKAISIGQTSLLLKYVRNIKEVYVKEAGQDRVDLTRKAYSWLVEEFGQDAGQKAMGKMVFTGNASADETLTIGTETYTFKETTSAATDVEIGTDTSTTISNLKSVINAQSSIVTADKYNATTILFEYYLVGTAGNEVAFTESVTNASLDGSGYLGGFIAGRASSESTGVPSYYSPIITTPHPSQGITGIPSEETYDMMFGEDRYQRDGIIFYPPSDKAYTMTILAEFREVLSDDLDVSYFSDQYPELLIYSANYALEATYRNSSGMSDWMAAMTPLLQGIDKDLVKEELTRSSKQLRG